MRAPGSLSLRRAASVAAGAVLAILLSACVAKPVRKFVAQPSSPPPWRLAILPVLPGSMERGKGKMKRLKVSRKTLEEIRSCLTLAMPAEAFEVIPIPYVDEKAAGMDLKSADAPQIQEVARALQADLVLLPGTYSWKRRYYLLHGVARVGIEARLYDGATGELVYRSMREQVKNQGILKIPAGYLAVVAGPILGLQRTHLTDMCHRVSEKISADLMQVHQAGRPEGAGLSTGPPGAGTDRPPPEFGGDPPEADR
jgi:hypothetical protein